MTVRCNSGSTVGDRHLARSLGRNLLTGLWYGFLCSLTCFVLAGVLTRLMGGAPVLQERLHITLWRLAQLYMVGGIAGGLIWGVLRPLNKWLWGAMVNGYFDMLPAWALFVHDQIAPGQLVLSRLNLTLALSLTGVLAGAYAWFFLRGDKRIPVPWEP